MNSELWTGAALLRKSATLAVGNFNVGMKSREDSELGRRLLKAGYAVVRDPELVITHAGDESLLQLLDRYWRWYRINAIRSSYRAVYQSFAVMATEDIRARDLCAVPISLLSPYYQIYRAVCARIRLKDD